MQLRNGCRLQAITCTVGKEYYISRGLIMETKTPVYKFVKSTEKGFNFLNLKTNKYLSKRHFYGRQILNQDNTISVKFMILEYFNIWKKGKDKLSKTQKDIVK